MNNLQLTDLKLKYLILDCEVLEDYFSLQIKNENSKVSVIEIECDEGFYKLYELFKTFTRSGYFYSIDYDPVIINCICKICENSVSDINWNLRKISIVI